MSVEFTYVKSPVGQIRIAQSADGLVEIALGDGLARHKLDAAWRYVENLECEATEQLRAYFNHELKEFDVKLVIEGTDFQRAVWLSLADISYGETMSYGELAKNIGRPKAVRAVGAANGRNPIPIILPCHRVIGSDGSLTGYGGGLAVKAELLSMERGTATLPLKL